jgi:hypothetical protein
MPVGTLNSSIFRRRSGHAVLMEFDKASQHLVISGKVLVVLQFILSARHSVRTRNA